MKDYYQVLGVGRFASASEIKIAYRKLAVLYHPDKNSDPSAEYKIKEINEAYQTLRDQKKRWEYDRRFNIAVAADKSVVSYQPRPAPHSAHHSRDHVNQKTERQKLLDKMNACVPFAYRIAWTGLFICLFLLFDYMLPNRRTLEKIRDKYAHNAKLEGMTHQQIDVIVTDGNNEFKLTEDESKYFNVGDEMVVLSSRLVGIPLSIGSGDTMKKVFYTTVYSNFLFLPLILLVTSCVALLYRQKVELNFNLGVFNLFFLILTLIFTFQSI